ncbi:MAG: hypothetical protein R2867_47585, partial [Caldilineaceae bacterium]
ALALYQEMVDREGAATTLEGTANCLQFGVGAKVLGAAHALRQAIGAPVLPVVQAEYTAWVAALRNALGAQQFADGWAEGEMLSYEAAVTLALAHLHTNLQSDESMSKT